jgi:hypothetical protein
MGKGRYFVNEPVQKISDAQHRPVPAGLRWLFQPLSPWHKMIECSFELNGRPMSTLKVASMRFPAFSGFGGHANRREFACVPDLGPIPPGAYYIFDRQAGGLLGPLRQLFTDHSDWFALYAIDGKLDDETYCNQVKRGNFRLHPRGRFGISKGCITLDRVNDFAKLRGYLKALTPSSVPGTDFKAYGRVVVR